MKISLRCPHHPKELEHLLWLSKWANSILEIGSRYGDTLLQMARAMPTKGRVVAVDLPGIQPWGYPDSEPHLMANMAILKKEGYDTYLFLGDSTNPQTVKAAKSLAPFDLVFIDGDHRYEGVKKDWENYGPLGKMVVFHDIVEHPKDSRNAPEVWRLWKEIEGNKTEFIAKDSLMGLGVVCR